MFQVALGRNSFWSIELIPNVARADFSSDPCLDAAALLEFPTGSAGQGGLHSVSTKSSRPNSTLATQNLALRHSGLGGSLPAQRSPSTFAMLPTICTSAQL